MIRKTKLSEETVDASIEREGVGEPIEVWIKVCRLDQFGNALSNAWGTPMYDDVEVSDLVPISEMERIMQDVSADEQDHAEQMAEQAQVDRSLGK